MKPGAIRTFDRAKASGNHPTRVNNIFTGATDTQMLRGFLGRDPEYGDALS